MTYLRRIRPEDIRREGRAPVDAPTLDRAKAIVEDVRIRGEPAVREYAERFAERAPGDPLVLGQDQLRAAYDALEPESAGVLERTADRIARFARAQREAIRDVDIPIPGGRAGHTVQPIESAGCYAPAGRYPLPSSVLMTAVTARVAGCERVVVASPGAAPIMLASAHVAGADEFLAIGGAHAVAALAHGFERFDPCDVIAGPGNKWVTAAKQLVTGVVGIDMLAGPSELLVIADGSADPSLVAADMLAQAEHDTDAVPMLVTTSRTLADAVETELSRQLDALPTRDTARAALRNGFACVTESRSESRSVADRIAAEHVQVMLDDAEPFARSIRNAGAIFIGARSAEVLGDYGAGPNHTLPTGGAARSRAGLSVGDFLRPRAWLRIDDASDAQELAQDARSLAQTEGLLGHSAAASARVPGRRDRTG